MIIKSLKPSKVMGSDHRLTHHSPDLLTYPQGNRRKEADRRDGKPRAMDGKSDLFCMGVLLVTWPKESAFREAGKHLHLLHQVEWFNKKISRGLAWHM